MDSSALQKLGEKYRDGRLKKGFTQKELAVLSNISVRSIQRLENGEILPRSYTLKKLSEILEISWTDLMAKGPEERSASRLTRQQKVILSIGVPSMLLLGVLAFVTQSASFPETLFEILALIFVVVAFTTVFLWNVWRAQ